MNDSEPSHIGITREVEFLQRYSREQVQHLGHPDYSPATNWLRKQGLTNLDVGRFALALAERNIQVPLIAAEPKTEFQSPWNDRDEFLNRLKEFTTLNRKSQHD